MWPEAGDGRSGQEAHEALIFRARVIRASVEYSIFKIQSRAPGIRVHSRRGKPPRNGAWCVLGAKAGGVLPETGRDWGEWGIIVGCVGWFDRNSRGRSWARARTNLYSVYVHQLLSVPSQGSLPGLPLRPARTCTTYICLLSFILLFSSLLSLSPVTTLSSSIVHS